MPASSLRRRLFLFAAIPLGIAMLPGTLAGPATDELAQVLDAIAATEKTAPRDRTDPAAVVTAADGDPVRLHSFVREQTRFVAYEGRLRGPLGTLLDRTGNSVDRSLLLQELLRVAGYEARLVQAALGDDQREQLLALLGTPVPPAAASAEPPPKAAGDDPIPALLARADAITAELRQLVPHVSAMPRAGERQHHWVQYRDGDAWRDLDATLAEPHARRAEPAGDGTPLPATTHRVQLQLTVERWQDGKLLEGRLHDAEFAATDTPLRNVSLTFLPVAVKQGKAIQRTFDTGEQLSKLLLQETAWCPVLLDGRSNGRLARMFDDAGIVHALPTGLSGAAELGNTTRNVFGGLGGEEDAAPSSVLTALFADFTLLRPDEAPQRVRRPVFDTLGPVQRAVAARSSLPRPQWTAAERLLRGQDLAGTHDALVAFAALPSEVYVQRRAQRLLDHRDALLAVAGGNTEPELIDRAAEGNAMRTLELFAAARAGGANGPLVVAEPQIYRRIVRPLARGGDAGLDCEVISDLCWNRLQLARPRTDGTPALLQGVLDSLLERLVVLRDGEAGPGDTTAALFAAAAARSIEPMLVRKADDARLAALPEGARARIVADLDAGFVAVVPSRPVDADGTPRLGWWRIDPHTGHTVGAMDTGWLQDMVEYTETQAVNGIRITRFTRVRVGPAAREWANNMLRRRGNTSWAQWQNLLAYAQRSIDTLGRLPPW